MRRHHFPAFGRIQVLRIDRRVTTTQQRQLLHLYLYTYLGIFRNGAAVLS